MSDHKTILQANWRVYRITWKNNYTPQFNSFDGINLLVSIPFYPACCVDRMLYYIYQISFYSSRSASKNELHSPSYSCSLLNCSLTYLLTPWSRGLLEKLAGFQLVKKFPTFHEPEGSSLHVQVPSTCPYPEPDQSSPGPHPTS